NILIVLIAYVVLKIIMIPLVLLMSSIGARLKQETQLGILATHIVTVIFIVIISLPVLSALVWEAKIPLFIAVSYVVYACLFMLIITGIYRVIIFVKQVKRDII